MHTLIIPRSKYIALITFGNHLHKVILHSTKKKTTNYDHTAAVQC